MDDSARAAAGRSRRRLLLGGGLAALATGATLTRGGSASAAPLTDAWLLGGNTGVDATNYLGARNVAPLLFKTAAVADTPLERMRITPEGRVGVGTNDPGAVLHARTTSGSALRGQATGARVGNTGVDGISTNGYGVVGKATGTGTGVLGQHTQTTGAAPGVLGETNSRSANAAGVVGRVNPADPGPSSGVWGVNNCTGPSGVGVWGSHAGGGYGVYATAVSGTGLVASGATGVIGTAIGVAERATGVRGDASQVAQSQTIGVEGQAWWVGVSGIASDNTSGAGVWGSGRIGIRGTGKGPDGIGVYAQGSGHAAYFVGDVEVIGTISKQAGSFKIDHPLDPERKWLSHSFVESPDMMNVYNGNVVLDQEGTATVELPAYFGALNRDFRYQLTAIGGAAPDLHVAEEVRDNRFSIAGGPAGSRVSWQVTGVRQDTYAREHPIEVEQDKAGPDAAPGRS